MTDEKTKIEATKPELSKEPRRQLTDREMASLIGGFIGVLCDQAESFEALQRAVAWWQPAANPAAWEAIAMSQSIAETARKTVRTLNEKERELLEKRMGRLF
jgi:hypothetical protein